MGVTVPPIPDGGGAAFGGGANWREKNIAGETTFSVNTQLAAFDRRVASLDAAGNLDRFAHALFNQNAIRQDLDAQFQAAVVDGLRNRNRVWGGVELAGAVVEGFGAAGLAAAPEPTLSSKAGAYYLGSRALDHAQSGIRQIITGSPSTTVTQQLSTSVYAAAGYDRQQAAMLGAYTEVGLDLAPLAASLRLPPGLRVQLDSKALTGQFNTGVPFNAIKVSQTPTTSASRLAQANAKLQALTPSSSFTPNGQRVLQNLTTQVNQRLAANPRAATAVLSPAELEASVVPGVARLQYGNAVERLVAREVRQDQTLRSIFKHVGGPNNPDFFGRGILSGQNFDITTPWQVGAHLARPGYGEGLKVITYERPPGFP